MRLEGGFPRDATSGSRLRVSGRASRLPVSGTRDNILETTEAPMFNAGLKEAVRRLLPRVQTPAQYIGGELNSVVKDHRQVRGKLCLAFPDSYTLGMSHHGLQVLYTIINNDPRWACERAFTPWVDFEALLRQHRLALCSLEPYA